MAASAPPNPLAMPLPQPARQLGIPRPPGKKKSTRLYIGAGVVALVAMMSLIFIWLGRNGAARRSPVRASAKSAEKLPAGAAMTPDELVPISLDQPVQIELPEYSFSAQVNRVLLTSDRRMAFVVVTDFDRHSQSWLELISIPDNEYVGMFEFPSSGIPFGVSANGQEIFSFGGSRANSEVRIDQWNLQDGGEVVHQRKLDLSGTRKNNVSGRPQDCVLLNDRTIFIRWSNGYSLIDTKTGQVVCEERLFGKRPVALSINGKYMAVQPMHLHLANRPKILIVNCDTLDLAAEFDSPALDLLAFSESGRLLAGITEHNIVKVLDAATGALQQEFPLPGATTGLSWLGDEYLSLPQCVLDVKRQCPLRLKGEGFSKSAQRSQRDTTPPVRRGNALGNRVYLSANSQSLGSIPRPPNLAQLFGGGTVTVATVQSPSEESLAQTPSRDDFYLDLRGRDVSIDVSQTWFGAWDADDVRESIAEQVAALGANVVERADIRVVCKTVALSKGVLSYRHGRTQRQFHYDRCSNEIVIYEGANRIWQNSQSSIAPALSEGTEAQIRAAAAKNNEPDIEFYRNIELTRLVPRGNAWARQWTGDGWAEAEW